MATKKDTAKNQIIFKITLSGTEPAIWRRLRLDSSMSLNDLHCAIQGAFGWEHSHLHMFTVSKNEQYSSNESSCDGELGDIKDSSDVTLQSLVDRKIKKIAYEYDFGDSWHHLIQLEKVIPSISILKYPECTEGERAGPPEDCGGTYGFENFKEIMADKKHPEHKEMRGGTVLLLIQISLTQN
jgi:hypothetical protein